MHHVSPVPHQAHPPGPVGSHAPDTSTCAPLMARAEPHHPPVSSRGSGCLTAGNRRPGPRGAAAGSSLSPFPRYFEKTPSQYAQTCGHRTCLLNETQTKSAWGGKKKKNEREVTAFIIRQSLFCLWMQEPINKLKHASLFRTSGKHRLTLDPRDLILGKEYGPHGAFPARLLMAHRAQPQWGWESTIAPSAFRTEDGHLEKTALRY